MAIKPHKKWWEFYFCLKLQFQRNAIWAKLSFWFNFYGVLLSYDHYENFTFAKQALKKFRVLYSFWKKKTDLALKSGCP